MSKRSAGITRSDDAPVGGAVDTARELASRAVDDQEWTVVISLDLCWFAPRFATVFRAGDFEAACFFELAERGGVHRTEVDRAVRSESERRIGKHIRLRAQTFKRRLPG